MNATRYGSMPIRLTLDNVEHQVQSLVSEYGAKFSATVVGQKAEFDRSLKQPVLSQIGDITLTAKMVRERSRDGCTVSLRFDDIASLERDKLKKMIAKAAVVPEPYVRKHVRLNTRDIEKTVNIPALAVVYFNGDLEILKVRDFTLSGLMLEATRDTSMNLSINDSIQFDMLTTLGDTVSGLDGVIVRTAEEWLPLERKVAINLGIELKLTDKPGHVQYQEILESLNSSNVSLPKR